jgi:MerR family glutamine synthetase transcriptional repressor
VGHNAGLHTLGQVRELTGLTDRRIRYYEQLGLLLPLRSHGRQRLYTGEDVDRLRRIKALLDAGVSLKQVRAELAHDGGLDGDQGEPGDAATHFRAVRWVHGDEHPHPDAWHRGDREG